MATIKMDTPVRIARGPDLSDWACYPWSGLCWSVDGQSETIRPAQFKSSRAKTGSCIRRVFVQNNQIDNLEIAQSV